MDIKGLSPCVQLLPELSESTHTQYFTEKKQKCLFLDGGKNKIPIFSVILMCLYEENMWKTTCMKIYFVSFLLP